ncbi:hypothetical protein [Sulfurimonas sp.]|uniref:hypothetical protein n=1 Tax=Sulfurimonas sp. TaxID=2022749 RepID=UPI003562D342
MDEEYDLENYERFLGEFRSEGVHWEKLEKRTATLFQVLIDGDLKELVFVLKHYPEYVETVCDHFRYLYNYSEQIADIYAASKLLNMSEGYHPKQFVRNLIRKLQKIDEYDISELKSFLDDILSNKEKIHPIILGYYKQSIESNIAEGSYHILQVKVIEKKLSGIDVDVSFDFSASDRDANLDIPYMD